jgi:hypothetical protein
MLVFLVLSGLWIRTVVPGIISTRETALLNGNNDVTNRSLFRGITRAVLKN